MSENQEKDSRTEIIGESQGLITPKEKNMGIGDGKQIARDTNKHPRFEWLDQFRGIVIVLFIVSAVTWILSGDFTALGNGQYTNVQPPVGPTYMNHGWKWADTPPGWPQMITLIDIGQQIFIFLVGFMQAFSFIRRKTTINEKNAVIHIIRRFLLIMLLSFIEALIGDFDISQWDWFDILWYGTLANIAWASLAAGLVAYKVQEGDKRLLIGSIILLVHAILYAIPALREFRVYYRGDDTLFRMPWNTINHAAIAIIGAAYASWILNVDRTVSETGLQKRVLPVSAIMFALTYLVDFLQPAHHQNCTTALAMMAIGTSGFMVFIFIQFDKYRFRVPGLTAFGKNMLLMFVLSLIVSEAFVPAIEDLAFAHPLYGLILAGICPILIMYAIAKFLEWRNIVVKI
jgi:hypothetical protein